MRIEVVNQIVPHLPSTPLHRHHIREMVFDGCGFPAGLYLPKSSFPLLWLVRVTNCRVKQLNSDVVRTLVMSDMEGDVVDHIDIPTLQVIVLRDITGPVTRLPPSVNALCLDNVCISHIQSQRCRYVRLINMKEFVYVHIPHLELMECSQCAAIAGYALDVVIVNCAMTPGLRGFRVRTNTNTVRGRFKVVELLNSHVQLIHVPTMTCVKAVRPCRVDVILSRQAYAVAGPVSYHATPDFVLHGRKCFNVFDALSVHNTPYDTPSHYCSICMDVADVRLTACGHPFCRPCIIRWFTTATEPRCPTCRRLFYNSDWGDIVGDVQSATESYV
eukprot:GFYU01009384.1.p1 GENE.GFYU01009384.1~~GFYU01009384.1.p1  ORF type:complete len:330 (-),score=40.49 GFYU01009384.1:48-1037(-)